MNERMQELALQAGFENGHQDRNGNSLSGELEKFAELIVRECAGQVNCYEALNIFEHFGVEQCISHKN